MLQKLDRPSFRNTKALKKHLTELLKEPRYSVSPDASNLIDLTLYLQDDTDPFRRLLQTYCPRQFLDKKGRLQRRRDNPYPEWRNGLCFVSSPKLY
jgi:hypothetical protein